MMGGVAAASAGNPSLTGVPMLGAGGAGMMGSEPGYAYTQLSCSPPT